jgi:hypothetical protein
LDFLLIILSPFVGHIILLAASPRRRNISRQQGIDRWLVALREHMRQSDFSRWAIKQYTVYGRRFLNHMASYGIRLEAARPDHIDAYLRVQRQRYRRQHGHAPADDTDWRSRYTASIHMLLRLAQGAWPPRTPTEFCIQVFKEKLQREQLRPGTVRQYLEQARIFLAYLDRQRVRLKHAAPKDLDAFISERLRIYRKRHGQSPAGLFVGALSTRRAFGAFCVARRDSGLLPRLAIPTFSVSKPT